MPTDDAGGGGDVPADLVAAVRHDRRREVLGHLVDANGELAFVELAGRLAASADATLPDVMARLHDVHLPELTDCGLVELDDRANVVSLAADPDVVETALATAAPDRDGDA